MSFLVRPAEAKDFDVIATITNDYIATTIHFGYHPVTAEELADARRAKGERYPWCVAESAGEVVGYAKAGEWRSRDAYRWTAEVGLYVMRERHGEGIGSALYGDLLATLATLGFHSAIGGIALPNPASIGLHTALGFEHVGTVRQAGWKHGAWHDVAFYQRMLRGSAAPPDARG